MRRFDVDVEHEDELTPQGVLDRHDCGGRDFLFMVLGVQALNWLWLRCNSRR